MNYTDLPELEKSIGYRVMQARVINGLSQMEIAGVLGVTFQQLQKYEKGVNRISPGKLFLLSKYLNIPITSFFEIDNFKSDPSKSTQFLSREEMEILKLFRKLENPKSRKKALELCKLLNDMEEDIV